MSGPHHSAALGDAPRDLDEEARQLYSQLQRHHTGSALKALPGLTSAALSAGRLDLALRLEIWTGQAHLKQGDTKLARTHLRTAAAHARALDDNAALEAISGLRQQLMATAMQAPPPDHSPDTPVAHALAAFDRSDVDQGVALAREARAQAIRDRNPREEVMSLLALARAPAHTEAALREAATVADHSGDFNLVTAVAHAARAAGVPLPPKVF